MDEWSGKPEKHNGAVFFSASFCVRRSFVSLNYFAKMSIDEPLCKYGFARHTRRYNIKITFQHQRPHVNGVNCNRNHLHDERQQMSSMTIF